MTVNFTHILGSELTLYVEGELYFAESGHHVEERLELISAKIDMEGEDILPYLNGNARREIVANFFVWRNV